MRAQLKMFSTNVNEPKRKNLIKKALPAHFSSPLRNRLLQPFGTLKNPDTNRKE